MGYERENCDAGGRKSQSLAAWEIYDVAVGCLAIYSLVSALVWSFRVFRPTKPGP